jgi:RNA polymerase sigma factor (sigma-70 family)
MSTGKASSGPAREESVMATEEEQQLIADVIKTLPMRLRKVFVMAHVQRKPRAEIAGALHISQRCVERRMAKALATCRRRLQER